MTWGLTYFDEFKTPKGVYALRGYFAPPLEPKTENYFSPIFFIGILEQDLLAAVNSV